MSATQKNRMIVSISLFIIFFLLIVSAIMIQILEEINRFSFAVHVWTAIHVLSGIVFTGFVIFHIIYNWKALKHYIMKKNRNL
jgi:hypothetical protein